MEPPTVTGMAAGLPAMPRYHWAAPPARMLTSPRDLSVMTIVSSRLRVLPFDCVNVSLFKMFIITNNRADRACEFNLKRNLGGGESPW